jgi:hypothetical protein
MARVTSVVTDGGDGGDGDGGGRVWVGEEGLVRVFIVLRSSLISR